MKNKSIIATVGAVGITTLLILFQVNTVGAAPAAAKPAPSTNRLARLLTGKEPPRLSVAQAEAFAQQNGRRPEALLAAYQASTEKAFLREAMEKYPRDARVALAAACIGGSDKNNGEVAQARRTWLDTFQRVAPTNALADYLSAREHFKTGQADLAVKEALAAAGKPVGDYALDWIQNTEEAYRSIGYPDAEARVIAMVTLLMPHLGQLRDLGKDLVQKANIDRNNGDAASAQKLLQTAANLGARLDGPGTPTLIQALVGVAIQRSVLEGLDPATTFGDSGQTVQTQLERLTERREAIRAMAKQFDNLLPTLSEKEVASYFDQQKRLGEEAAERWALNKHDGR